MGFYLSILSSGLVFLPITLGVYSLFQKSSNLAFKILMAIFIIWGIVEVILIYLAFHHAHNQFWLNAQCVITTSLFIVYYCLTIGIKKDYLYYLVAGYLAFALWWFFSNGSIYIWSIPFIIVSSIILVAFSAYSLIELVNSEQEDLFNLDEFWINAGVLVYFTGSLLYLSFFQYMVNSKDSSFINSVQDVHTVINIIGNILYSIAFLCRIRTYKAKLSSQ